ncbi:MAG: HAMP domain-containing histidine kinase, partial [Clostridia bacterium]|nr:HAMP domain-containing histidine kinase [Clostridia bacterium]
TRLQNMEKKDLVFEEVSVISLLEEVVGPLRRIAESKEITLKEEYGYTGNVSCISGQLQHAIQNLIENAIKYNHEGGSVTVGTKEENGEIVFFIDDDGEGIPEAEQEKIFERFYRVSKSRARETGGSGLGLYIVQTIVRLHGGRITLESAEGEGSTFYIHLPKKGNDREKE